MEDDHLQYGNYVTYERAFSDAAAEAVRKRAEGRCAERRQVAVMTSNTCTLSRCFTSYQCVDRADVPQSK